MNVRFPHSVKPQRIRWVMLIVTVFTLFCSTPVKAQQFDAQYPDEPLSVRLKKISTQGGASILFDPQLVGDARSVAVSSTKNLTTGQLIAQSLQGTSFSYKKTAATSYAVVKEETPASQPTQPTPRDKGSLTGTVLDESGQPVTGATVSVPGTTIGTATDADGKYTLQGIPEGTTKVQFALMGYETQVVSDVKINANRATPLDIVLKEGSTQLGEVVVTAKSYKAANEAGVLRQQQTMAQVSSVISAQQIGKTSDKNLGEALKRVTGISTMDNKYVVVRGLGERWNQASLDGVTLPSSEPGNKAFSFDLIPTNIIDNVVVSKSPMPDQNATFAGGFVQISTKAIPDENFITLSVGGTWNSVSTGKTQLGRELGSMDWLGFDDGRRKWPTGLRPNFWASPFRETDLKRGQTHRFAGMGDNFTLHSRNTPPAHNVQFTIGRTKTGEDGNRFGFVGSLSYRNTQQQTVIEHQGRGDWERYIEEPDEATIEAGQTWWTSDFKNPGATYKYGTVLSGLFNAGWQWGSDKVNFRNTYTRKHDNDLTIITGWNTNDPYPETITPHQTQFNAPTFQDLLQNKLDGEHLFGKVKLNWDLAHTYVRRNQPEVIQMDAYVPGGKYAEGEAPLDYAVPYYDEGPTRSHYDSKERDFNWGVSAELPFKTGAFDHIAKLGYMGVQKSNTFLFEDMYYQSWEPSNPNGLPGSAFVSQSVADKTDPFNMTEHGYFWGFPAYAGTGGGQSYEASSSQHDFYLMFDHRWGKMVRLVWGSRIGYYKYDEKNNPYYNPYNFSTTQGQGATIENSEGDKPWEIMPSAALTVTPVENLNLRMSYGRSLVRPEFSERTSFMMWDPWLDAYNSSRGVNSSTVDAADFKAEWFPGAGEIISAGVFYRYIDQPVERILEDVFLYTNPHAYLQNQKWARNWGFEFELRKNFAFIYDHPILRDLYVYGNATITNSEVQELHYNWDAETESYIGEEYGATRPLYGQTPLIYNVGLTYEGSRLGANLALNHTSRRMNIASTTASQYEYESPSNTLDAQISYTFPKQGVTLKLNASNLLNEKSIFYWNSQFDFEPDPEHTGAFLNTMLPGKSDSYDKHDVIRHKSYKGYSVSFSASWTF